MLSNITVHKDKVADAPAHHKEMEDFMRTEILVECVEYGKLQRIDDAADCVDDAARKEPSKCGMGERVPKRAENQQA